MAAFSTGRTLRIDHKEFGEKRLIDALHASRRQSPEVIYRRVVESVRQWQGDLKQHDGITLIVAKVE